MIKKDEDASINDSSLPPGRVRLVAFKSGTLRFHDARTMSSIARCVFNAMYVASSRVDHTTRVVVHDRANQIVAAYRCLTRKDSKTGNLYVIIKVVSRVQHVDERSFKSIKWSARSCGGDMMPNV